MPTLTFAPALARWRTAEPIGSSEAWSISADGATLRDLFEAVFQNHPALRGYVLDERGALRHHVVVFIDGEPLADKRDLGHALAPNAEIHILQALSGG